MSSVNVHLVRHGQSTWNVQKRMQGQTVHPPLTDQGRADAMRAATELGALTTPGSTVIYTSDQVRALQTAEIIGEQLGLDVRTSRALREMGGGSFEGMLTSDIPAEPAPDGVHFSEYGWGGGESLADVYARLAVFFGEVLRDAVDEHLVVVTHGDTIRAARALLSGKGHREIEWDVVPNGSVETIAIPRGQSPGDDGVAPNGESSRGGCGGRRDCR